MKASVIIPTLDGGNRLEDCAFALSNQDFNYPWEVVIIDSGSVDSSINNVREILNTKKISNKLIRISKKDFSHGMTRNRAIDSTNGEIVALLTQDAVPHDKDWLKTLISVFETDNRVAGTFGRHLAHHDHPNLVARNLDNHFSIMARLPFRKIDDMEEYKENEQLRQQLHFFSNNNSALRKSVWLKHPFPKVDYGEDQTWAKLILEEGYSISYVPQAIVHHSHYYNLVQSYRRTLIEINFFREHFGYNLSQSPLLFFSRLLRQIFTDLLWLKKNEMLKASEIIYSFKSHLGSNLARSIASLKKYY
ncbi:MAG: glycosyltransferase family 2 protein [Opitutales bacterium]